MIKALILLLLFLPSGLLFGRTVMASGGSAAQVQAAIDSAGSGDTVEIPSGSYTWTGGVQIRKYIKLQGNGANLTFGFSGTMIDVAAQSAGHVEISGINFKPGSGNDQSTYIKVNGNAQVVLMHDCEFSIPNFQLARAVDWNSSGGVIWKCRFFSDTQSSSSGPGSGSGGLRHLSQVNWNDRSTWGMEDADGTKNLYIEDCVLDNIYNQCIDCDDNSRSVIRYCTINNSQVLTHGTTSKYGGRQMEYYHNRCKYFQVGGMWVNVNRWIWIRAGTLRVWGCEVDALDSKGYWGGWKPSWVFIAESLTRSGAGAPCQNASQYPNGTHWPGTGTDGSSQKNGTDPVRLWDNTGQGATRWGTNDQSGYGCSGGVTADVFKLNRDIYVDSPPSGYTPYTYPHPLRVGGGPSPTPTSTPQPTSTPTPQPTSTPTPPQPTPSPTPPITVPNFSDWLNALSQWIKDHPPRENTIGREGDQGTEATPGD